MAARGACLLLVVSLLLALARKDDRCPSAALNPTCPCFTFDDGIFLECPAATVRTLNAALHTVSGPVQSLSVYDLDKSVTLVTPAFFPAGIVIRHLQISHSGLREVGDDALRSVRGDLESFGLVNGKLREIPVKAFSGMNKLMAVDLESNEIGELASYTFHGMRLIKLNVKGNRIERVSEYAFAGLEDSLTDLDMSENKLKVFPIAALRTLNILRTLRMSWNEIGFIPDDGYSRLDSLTFLDLNSNNFDKLGEDCFRMFPFVRTLSLYSNVIESVHPRSLTVLVRLESLDLSHNKIVLLDPSTFQSNKRLRSLDLSHNHVHHIGGLFASLPDLDELFLSENNILEVSSDAFTGAVNLSVIYMQQNAIRRVDAEAFSTLANLTQLHLSSNFIPYIARDLFRYNAKLNSLSLDHNSIADLEPGTFDKSINLREIRAHDNRIESIHRGVFDPLPSLLELHLQFNRIARIDLGAFRTLQSLQHVNLQGNVIVELGDVFMHTTPSLVSIQLDSNNLISLHNDSLRGQCSVQIMWLGHNKLKYLSGVLFKDLVNVQKIYLVNNSISRIEERAFAPMQALKFLDLGTNRLGEIEEGTFADLRELEELHLSRNVLSAIQPRAFTHLKKLRILDLSYNPLVALHEATFQEGLPIRVLNLMNCSIGRMAGGTFRGLNNLNELNLNNNQLTANDSESMDIPGLRVLRYSHNALGELSAKALNGLPSLQVVLLTWCRIEQVPRGVFSNNKDLVKIDLSYNGIKELSHKVFDNLNVLKELRLSGNLLAELPHRVLNISVLEILSLSHNNMKVLDVPKLVLPGLKELDVSYNKISSLSGFASSNLTQLLSVDLSGNLLATLPADFFRHSPLIRRIDLSANRFQQIANPALAQNNLPHLSWLNLTGNPLVRIHDITISMDRYPALEELHISRTNLTLVTSKDFENYPALLHVYLGYNRISRISPGAFGNLPNLLTLDLGENELEFLPQERLRGFGHLRTLNLSHNQLKQLEEFPSDMHSLQILDVSFNQIDRISGTAFQHLAGLVELYLYSNRIATVGSEAFRALRKLRTLDLSRNYLEHIPLSAFKPLETQIRSLRIEENPLSCTCDLQDLWEWFRDHRKVVMRRHANDLRQLRCEHPAELRDRVFMELDPEQFCDEPLVVKLAIQDIQPFSVLVSWQARNYSGLNGYQVAYYSIDNNEEIRARTLDRNSRSLRLTHLNPNARYVICVLAQADWPSRGAAAVRPAEDAGRTFHREELFGGATLPLPVDSVTGKCSEVDTLDAPDGSHAGLVPDHSVSHQQSILTRRLGLIVGCCMGFMVFVLLVSVLGYLKAKKQRRALKREQRASVPPQYMSYRHYSLQSGELGSQHLHFISSGINTTALN